VLERILGVEISDLEGADFSFLTAYGDGAGSSDVAIVGGSPRIVEWFADWMDRAGEPQPQAPAQTETRAEPGRSAVRQWIHRGSPTAMMSVDLPGDRVAMIIADSAPEVVGAANVLRGQAASLAAPGPGGQGGAATLAARPATGSIIFITAEGVCDFEGFHPRAIALRQTQRLAVDLGEHDGAVFLTASLTATGPEHAAALRDLLSGLRGWGRLALQQPSQRRLAEFVDRIELRVDGAQIDLTLRAPVATEQPAGNPEADQAPAP
jgi:hypothetical protein